MNRPQCTDDNDNGLSYEDVLEILEQELLKSQESDDNPYRPLNFHDPNESFE